MSLILVLKRLIDLELMRLFSLELKVNPKN